MLARNEIYLGGRANTDPSQNVIHRADDNTIYVAKEPLSVLINTFNTSSPTLANDPENIRLMQEALKTTIHGKLEMSSAKKGQFLLAQHARTVSIIYVKNVTEVGLADVYEFGALSVQDADLDGVMQALKTLSDAGEITQSLVRLCTPCTGDLIPLTYNELEQFIKMTNIPKRLFSALNTCLEFNDSIAWSIADNSVIPHVNFNEEEKDNLIKTITKVFGKDEDTSNNSNGLTELYTFKKLDSENKNDKAFYQVNFCIEPLMECMDSLYEHAVKKKINDLINNKSLSVVLDELRNITDENAILYVGNTTKAIHLLDEIYACCTEAGRSIEFFSAFDQVFPIPLIENIFQGIKLNESQLREHQTNWLFSFNHQGLRDKQGNLTSKGETWYTRLFIVACNAYDESEKYYPQRIVDHIFNVLSGASIHGTNDLANLRYRRIKPEYTGNKPIKTDTLLQIAKATYLHEVEIRERFALMQNESNALIAELAKSNNGNSAAETLFAPKRKSEHVSSSNDVNIIAEDINVKNAMQPHKKFKNRLFDNNSRDSKRLGPKKPTKEITRSKSWLR